MEALGLIPLGRRVKLVRDYQVPDPDGLRPGDVLSPKEKVVCRQQPRQSGFLLYFYGITSVFKDIVTLFFTEL